MASKDKKTTVARRSTFQRMLDLEKKNKLDRMQASPQTSYPVTRSSTALVAALGSNGERPTSLKLSPRAMSTPSLSVFIPPPKSSINSSSRKFVIHDGDVVPEEALEALEDDNMSETSSICHSPGWDDLMGSKRKKEKQQAKEKKKEREKAEAKAKTEAKHAEKVKNRLSKTRPPNSSRHTMTSVAMDRSTSAPAVHTLSNFRENSKDEDRVKGTESARRGSVEVGLKSFIQATHAIPVPWRSSHGTPTETTPSSEEPPTAKSSATIPRVNSGFIGGLKLRLVDEATMHAAAPKLPSPKRERTSFGFKTKNPPVLNLGALEHDKSKHTGEDTVDTHSDPYEGAVRTPQQWDSIYEQAARMMRTPNGPDVKTEESPIMDRNVRKPQKKYPPTSSYFPMETDVSPRRDSSSGSNARTSSRPRTSEENSQGGRTSSAFSHDQPSPNTRDTSVERPISSGRNFSYVGRQRKQSEDLSISGLEEENRVAEKVASRGRKLSWAGITNRPHIESTKMPLHVQTSRNPNKAIETFTSPPSSSMSAGGGHSPTSPTGGALLRRRTNSKDAIPTLKSIRSAAMAAFGRTSSAVSSPTGSLPSSSDNPSPKVARIPEKLSKAERFFGHTISSADVTQSPERRPDSRRQTDSTPQKSNGKTADLNGRALEANSSGIAREQGQQSHSRPATDSSEDYSIDESSAITTPMASKPSSDKDYFPPQEPLQNGHTGPAIMTNAMPPQDKSHERANTFHSTDPRPIHMASEQHGQYRQSISKKDLEASELPPDLNRQPSITRSMSTPELQQDLSFLPVLKHQALTKPSKESKMEAKKAKGPRARSQAPEPENTLVRPPSLSPLSTSRSESSPPASPGSSKYLQNARLSIPRSPARSGPLTVNQGIPDPIAKMFVVCCACKYFHDMPSKIYECMTRAESVVEDKDLGVRGVVSTSVRCPWCGHGMSTSCCAGYAAVVILREKLH